MRVFLDENVDLDLVHLLSRFKVESAYSMGWCGVQNGQLLVLVRSEFDAMITQDRGILFQQNHKGHNLIIVVLRFFDGTLVSLHSLIPTLVQRLESADHGDLIELDCTV